MTVALHSEEAERSVIGAVLLRNDSVSRVQLKPDDFFDPRRRKIWRTIVDLVAERSPVDGVLIGSRLNGDGGSSLLSELSECVDATPTADNIEYYARIVGADSLTRRVRVELERLANDQRLDGVDLLEAASRALVSLRPSPALLPDAPPLTADLRSFVGDDEPVEDESPSPEDWIIPGFVPRGSVTVVGGPPKACKTYLILDMALAIATGKPFAGHWPTFPGRVMAFLEEDTKRRIRSRFWWLARGRGLDPRHLGDAVRLAVMSGFRLDREGVLERLEREIVAYRPSVLMLDALARIHSADENDRTAMRQVTVPLQDLCTRHGITIIVIHHFRGLKEGEEDKRSGELLRGTTDLHALARSVVGLRKRKEGFLAIDAAGNEGEIPFHRLDFTLGTDERGRKTVSFVCRGLLAESAVSEDADEILAAIVASMPTGMGTRELRATFKGKGSPRLDAATAFLSEKGRIHRYTPKAPWMTREGDFS